MGLALGRFSAVEANLLTVVSKTALASIAEKSQ